jgi:hypothetical protein
VAPVDPPRDLERAIDRNAWRLDALDDWRRRVDDRLFAVERQMAELVKADEIAEAVAEKMSDQQTIHLSRDQRRFAFFAGGATALGTVSGIVALGLHIAGVG